MNCGHQGDRWCDRVHPDLTSLKKGDILLSPYNSNAYKLMGIRDDLNLESKFPSRPKADFYDPSVTKVHICCHIRRDERVVRGLLGV